MSKAIPTAERGEGEFTGFSCTQSFPVQDHVSPAAPNTATACMAGSNAAPAPTYEGICLAGESRVQFLPSHVQVLSVRIVSPFPPVSTTLRRIGSRTAIPQPRG